MAVVHPEIDTERELLDIAALAESCSDHPISLSLRAAYARTVDKTRVANVEDITGQGIRATVDGKTVCAGNSRLMDSVGAAWKPCEHEGTIIHVAVDGTYVGHIVIADEIKPQSKAAIAALRSAGVKKTVMLTGDCSALAANVAAALGIDESHAELMPADRVVQVERLLTEKSAKGQLAFGGTISTMRRC